MNSTLGDNIYIRLIIFTICIGFLFMDTIIINMICTILILLNRFGYNDLTLIMFNICLITILIKILLLKINLEYKVFLISCILAIYATNLKIMLTYSKLIFFPSKQSDNINDINVNTKIITRMFNQVFDFKHNFYKLPDKPTIYVCNYVYDRLEHLSWLLIPKSVYCIMNYKIERLFKRIVKHIIKRNGGLNTFQDIKTQIKEKLDTNFSILVYVTTPKEKVGEISRLRTGMFRIAKELNRTITPIAIDYIHYDHFGSIPYQRYEIRVGDSFYVDDPLVDSLRTRKFFKDSLEEFKNNKFT